MTPPLVWFLCSSTLVLLALLGVDSDGLLLIAGLAGLLMAADGAAHRTSTMKAFEP